MKTQKIKDNTKYPKSTLTDIEALLSKISDKTLNQLRGEDLLIFPETVKPLLGGLEEKQYIIQNDGENYLSGNVMGFIGYGEEELIIRSRFGCNEDGKKGKDFFFQYLLSEVLRIPPITSLTAGTNMDEHAFDWAAFLFPSCLQTALRKGPFKEYVWHQYNDMSPRGTIDIPRHIKINTPFAGKIAYSERERSCDNALMELVRHTIEAIKRKPFGPALLAKTKDEARLITSITPRYARQDKERIIKANEKRPIRHAFFSEYRSLQKLCLFILRHQRHTLAADSPKRIHGILFDGAWLWEEYINSLIKDRFYHPRNKEKEGAEQLFEKNNGLIYPDFIGRDASRRVIGDAKYKPSDNINGDDYLQLLAYMFRFDSKVGYFFYPRSVDSKESEDKTLRLNKGLKCENSVSPRDDIRISKCGFPIPDGEKDYGEFEKAMKKSEDSFKSASSTKTATN